VRIDGMPLVCRAIGLPAATPGERLRVAFGEPDLWEAGVLTRYAGK
jgi:exoribonuclease II